MTHIYDNPWMQLKIVEDKLWANSKRFNSYDISHYYNVGLEYLLPNGKIVKSIHFSSVYDKEQRKLIYDHSLVDSYETEGEFPIDEVKFRYEDKTYQKVRTLLDLIEVGDFVRAKSRANDYRKVLTIDPRGKIFGQAYRKPFEDDLHARLVSSENSMVSIMQVFRDGEKIYGK